VLTQRDERAIRALVIPGSAGVRSFMMPLACANVPIYDWLRISDIEI
jgi:hypothetical protein